MKQTLFFFKKKLKFIDDNLSKLGNNDSFFEAWGKCNVMVLSWMTRTLTLQIVKNVVYTDVVKNLWKDLK